MTELTGLIAVCLAGVLIGVGYFGGLWWTIRHSVVSTRPAISFLLSLLLRNSLAVLGFYAVSGADWQRWLLCLLGFTLARLLMTRLILPTDSQADVFRKES